MPQTYYYENIFSQLNKGNIRYVVAGGIAVVLHGVVRFTADLDIVVELSQENVERFIKVIKKLGYRPKIPVKAEDFGDPIKRKRWKEEKGMHVFSLFHPKKHLELIDVFVDELIPFDELAKEKKIVRAKGINIPIVSIKHLKKLKRISARPQDLADIKSLEELEKLERKS